MTRFKKLLVTASLLLALPTPVAADPPGMDYQVRDCKALPSGGGYACVRAGDGEIVFCTSWDPQLGMGYGCTA